MKKNAIIAAMAALVAACTPQGVDVEVDTGRYSLRILSPDMYPDVVYSSYDTGDTLCFTGTIPRMAFRLAVSMDGDSTTMYWVDDQKQGFLPDYCYCLVDSDTSLPVDYTPLLQALIDRHILRADTTYEPLRLLEIYDTARYARSVAGMDVDSTVLFSSVVHEGEPDSAQSYFNAISIVSQLRESHRMPVMLSPGVEPTLPVEMRWMNDDWTADSLWLDANGFRLVPDPQGRQMRIVVFNRHKGKI